MTSSTKARKIYELRRGRGYPTTVPIERVQAHIEHLNSLGITNQMIAHAAGFGVQTINHIQRRNTTHTRIDHALKILAVTHHPHPNQLTVPAIGARRRVRALTAIGWSTTELARRLGQGGRCVLNNAIAKDTLTYELWDRIRRLYDELSGTPGGSARSLYIAKRNHYMPPLAWWDRDIDHPHTQPDWAAVGVRRSDRPTCQNGHPRTPDNTGTGRRGQRRCLTCLEAARQRAKERYAATRAANRGVYGKQS